MNDTKKARIRVLIASRLDEIEQENQRGSEGQGVVVLDQQSVGRLSRMDALQNQAMALAQQKRRDQQATRLRSAMLRLDDEDFGFCDECGDEIAFQRLELDPSCRCCITCAAG